MRVKLIKDKTSCTSKTQNQATSLSSTTQMKIQLKKFSKMRYSKTISRIKIKPASSFISQKMKNFSIRISLGNLSRCSKEILSITGTTAKLASSKKKGFLKIIYWNSNCGVKFFPIMSKTSKREDLNIMKIGAKNSFFHVFLI